MGAGPKRGCSSRGFALISLDTTFLIDLQREMRGLGVGPASQWMKENEVACGVSAICIGELVEGLPNPDHPVLDYFLHRFVFLPVDRAVATSYGKLVKGLRAKGQLIGTNDLWIAATALVQGVPLLTRNIQELGRVPGLRLMTY